MAEHFLDDDELKLDEYPYTSDVEARETAHIYTDVRTMQKLLNEVVHLRKQVTELQKRGTELVMENRDLKRKLADKRPPYKDFVRAQGH